MPPGNEWPEIGHDILDRPRARHELRWPWLPRRRPVLGIRSTGAPTILFILCGIVLGPRALGVLTPGIVDRLDIAVSVALAIVGVFVGIGLAASRGGGRALIGGTIASLVTIAIVAGGLFLLVRSWEMHVAGDVMGFAALVAICCSVSAALHLEAGPENERAARVADLDDVSLVVLGSTAIAFVSATQAGAMVERLALTAAAGAAIGVAGWLLFERASGPAERGVFVTGAVLLLAGVGAYLGTSPLLSGCVAALIWVRAPGPADRITSADLRALQHPLVSLLLIFAGALIEWSPRILWLAAVVLLLRLMGKLLASLAIARLVRVSPVVLASALLPPGVMGIAVALNIRQVVGGDAAEIVAIVTIAAGASELLAAFLPLDVEAQ